VKTALAYSGGKDSTACLHLMRDKLDCAIFVNTGFAFPETLAMVEYASQLVPMHIVHVDRKGQNEREGIPADVVPVDWTPLGHLVTGPKPARIQSYLACHFANITRGIWAKAIELGITHLVNGQRNSEHHKSIARNGLDIFGIERVQPLDDWSEEDVYTYLGSVMDVPPHFALNHSSLDCYDCTGFRARTLDRIAWAKVKHPELHAEFEERDRQLKQALAESIGAME
jgi:3'-phosphoadenosine 5'-phosphosulfate sulfotransferase (PAPS reductase)/FAD synthetase